MSEPFFNTMHSVFLEIVQEEFPSGEAEIFVEVFDLNYFSRIKEGYDDRDFSSDDVRGFGVDVSVSLDLLVQLIGKLSLVVGSKLVADVASTKIYLETLTALQKMDQKTLDRFQPWARKLQDYLEKKCK